MYIYKGVLAMEFSNEVINLLNGCGAGVILLVGLYFFIKYIAEQSKLNSEERIETHKKFCETISELQQSFFENIRNHKDSDD